MFLCAFLALELSFKKDEQLLNKITERFSKSSKIEKILWGVAVIFVGAALLDRLFISPVFQKFQTIREEIKRQKTNMVRDTRFLSYRDKIVKESQIFSRYYTNEIQDDDVINAEFLSSVERLASRSNVNLVKSSPTEIKKTRQYLLYYSNLDCTGNLEDVIGFMYKINTTNDLLKIVKFNMSPQRGSTAADVNASMTIVKLIVPVKDLPETAVQTK